MSNKFGDYNEDNFERIQKKGSKNKHYDNGKKWEKKNSWKNDRRNKQSWD